MVRQERDIIDTLFEAWREGRQVVYWELVEQLVRKYLNPGDRLRDGSVEIIALFNRLIREKKVKRDRIGWTWTKKCYIKLTDRYAAQLNRFNSKVNSAPVKPKN